MTTQPVENHEDAVDEKMEPAKARRDFYHLAIDWVHIKLSLPTPPKRDIIRRNTNREYGHPAEWASATSALIADMFSSWHAMMAEHRNETPPPASTTAEAVRVTAAWRYLEPRIEQLCDLVTKDDLQEISDLHYKVRRVLQLDRRPTMWMSIECPICDLRTVFRNIEGERLSCGNCGWTDMDDHKDFHVFRTLVNVVERHESFLP